MNLNEASGTTVSETVKKSFIDRISRIPALSCMMEEEKLTAALRFFERASSAWQEACEKHTDFLFALSAYACIHSEEAAQELFISAMNASVRAMSDMTDPLFTKYSAYTDILDEYRTRLDSAAAEEQLAAVNVLQLLTVTGSFLDVEQPSELLASFISSAEEYEKSRQEYGRLSDELFHRLRTEVNSPQECLRLAKAEDGLPQSGQCFVYFQNGTSVTLWDEELPKGSSAKQAAAKKLTDCKNGWLNYCFDIETDDKNALGDTLHMLCYSPEQGSMNGIAFWYWASDEGSSTDSDLAYELREADCRELRIVYVAGSAAHTAED